MRNFNRAMVMPLENIEYKFISKQPSKFISFFTDLALKFVINFNRKKVYLLPGIPWPRARGNTFFEQKGLSFVFQKGLTVKVYYKLICKRFIFHFFLYTPICMVRVYSGTPNFNFYFENGGTTVARPLKKDGVIASLTPTCHALKKQWHDRGMWPRATSRAMPHPYKGCGGTSIGSARDFSGGLI